MVVFYAMVCEIARKEGISADKLSRIFSKDKTNAAYKILAEAESRKGKK